MGWKANPYGRKQVGFTGVKKPYWYRGPKTPRLWVVFFGGPCWWWCCWSRFIDRHRMGSAAWATHMQMPWKCAFHRWYRGCIIGKMVGKPLGMVENSCWTPLLKPFRRVIYPINISYKMCIWGWLLKVPSQGYLHFPYDFGFFWCFLPKIFFWR